MPKAVHNSWGKCASCACPTLASWKHVAFFLICRGLQLSIPLILKETLDLDFWAVLRELRVWGLGRCILHCEMSMDLWGPRVECYSLDLECPSEVHILRLSPQYITLDRSSRTCKRWGQLGVFRSLRVCVSTSCPGDEWICPATHFSHNMQN
jgi:hypothetical protein